MWAFSDSSTVDDVANAVTTNWKKPRGSFLLIFRGCVLGSGDGTLKSIGVLDRMSLEVADVQHRFSF